MTLGGSGVQSGPGEESALPIVERKSGRMDSLQVLRALAALAVVLFHCDWTGIASFGVELFFVLSGFIICHAAALDSRQFLAKRLARVVPLYWSATLGIFAIATVLPQLVPSTQPTVANLVRSMAFFPYAREDGFAFPLMFLGWTLNYEMLFYVIFAIALMVRQSFAPALAAAVIVVLVVVHPLVAPTALALDFWTRPILLNFLCGIAAWAIWKRFGEGFQRVPASLAGLVSAGVFAALVGGIGHGLGGQLPILGILSAVLLLAMLRLDSAVVWPALLLLIGDASYSLYLLHPYVVEGFDRLVFPLSASPLGIVTTVVAVAAAIVGAIVSFRVIERPSNHALRTWLGRLT